MSDRLLSIPKAAERLGDISVSTLRGLIRTRQIGHTRVRRRVMVAESELDRYIEQQTTPAAGKTKARLRPGRKEARSESTPLGQGHRLLDVRELYKQHQA